MVKVILFCISDDVMTAVGPLQTCAGHAAGSEAVVHAMRDLFCRDDYVAALLVDASNASNSVYCQAALHNISISLFMVLNNTYGSPVRLFVMGEEELASTEGTTQGDPLAIAMYATPLIKQLCIVEPDSCLLMMPLWWGHCLLCLLGGSIFLALVQTLDTFQMHIYMLYNLFFAGSNIQITSRGQRHLDAALGTHDFCHLQSVKVDR